jgi:hypothetical protein
MKKTLFLLFTLSVIRVLGQVENIESGKYHPAKEHFETQYKKQEHQKLLKSQIKIEKDKVIIDNIKSIEFSEHLDKKYKLILENGLIDPIAINGNPILIISDIDELVLLNPNPQTKRFKFWVFPKKKIVNINSISEILSSSVNPSEYYFELQNEHANEKTTFNEFIEGAKLTFLAFGTIII